jgi:hypothetical protein
LIFIVKRQIIACDPMEVVFDDDLGEDLIGFLIFYCLDDILVIMDNCRWPLSQTHGGTLIKKGRKYVSKI